MAMLLYCSGTYQVIKPQLLVSLAYLQITRSGDQFLALLYHIITITYFHNIGDQASEDRFI